MIVGQFSKLASESLARTVDFAPELTTGETISLPVVTIKDQAGTDVTVAMLDGAPFVQAGTAIVQFQVKAGTSGAEYAINLTVTSSGTQKLAANLILLVMAAVFPAPSPIDLTTLSALMSWLRVGSLSGDEQSNIQSCITAASRYWHWRTGHRFIPAVGGGAPQPAMSPFVQVVPFDEWYNGSGSDVQFLKETPIVSVTSVEINGRQIPASLAWGQAGYVVDDNRKSLVMRAGGGGHAAGLAFAYFCKGKMNLRVQYSAGYDGVPDDVELAVRQMVALNYKRSQWIGQKSQSMGAGAGSITFEDWEVTPAIRSVMIAYTRCAIP